MNRNSITHSLNSVSAKVQLYMSYKRYGYWINALRAIVSVRERFSGVVKYCS